MKKVEKGIQRVSLRYLKVKISSTVFRLMNQKAPWWNKHAVNFAKIIIGENDSILEFGSGRSTIWLAERCKKLTSIEHNKNWYEKVRAKIERKGLDKKVNLKHLALISTINEADQPYLNPDEIINEAGYDIIIIDGKCRSKTTLMGLEFLKRNGILIIDDVHRYLPSDLRFGVNNCFLDLEDDWKIVWGLIKEWREIRTTDGIHETAFFFKS